MPTTAKPRRAFYVWMCVRAICVGMCVQSAVQINTPPSLSGWFFSFRLAASHQTRCLPIGLHTRRRQIDAVAKILLLSSCLVLGNVWCIMDGWFDHGGANLKCWWLEPPSLCHSLSRLLLSLPLILFVIMSLIRPKQAATGEIHWS